MKKWTLLLTILILSIGHFSWGSKSDHLSWPSSLEQIDKNPLSYKIIKMALFDLEDFLKESLGIETQICQYTSLRKKRSYNYSETGACIYRLLLDSIFSKEAQSSVYIWGMTTDGKKIQLKFDWRPQLNNVLEVYNQIFEMAFEKQIHAINKRNSKPFKIDFEKRGFGSETSLLGQISIKAKSSPETIHNLLSLLSEHPPEHIQVSGVSIKFTPNGRMKGYMNQKIKVQVWQSEESELTDFQLTTNLNLLDPSRTFIVKSTPEEIQK